MVALSGVVLGRIFAGALLGQLVAGAAVGSVGVSVAARRLPNWMVAPLSAVLLAAYTLLALKIAADRAETAGALTDIVRESLVNGIPRLLTALIPVEATPDTVVVPVIAAWLAGLAGAEIAVRAGRVLLGLVPATALYAGALYVVGPNADTARWTTLVFAGLAVVALAASARATDQPRADDGKVVRGRASAAAGLVIVLGLIVAVGPWIGGRVGATPVDPRRYVEPPQVDSLDESPLNRISGWALEPKDPLLRVSPAAGAKGKVVRLRLAVLPDYDGVTWRVGATYRNAGRVLPPSPRLPGTDIAEIRQDVTIDGLAGRLLPVVPAPTEVAGARVAFDAATGTLIQPEGRTAGLTYSVTSELQTPDLNLLPTAETPSGDTVARYLTVGAGVPPEIQRLADELAQDNGAAYDRAMAIQEFIAEHYRRVADAPSGHAYPNLKFFLFGPRQQGGQAGTSEQFAASFALLARIAGLPSRVVVGFDAPAAGGTVTAGNAIAWPEVLFDGLGWVAFDPMPKSKDPRPVEEDFLPKPTPPPTPSSPAPAPSETPPSSGPPTLVAAPPGPGPSAAVVAGSASGSVLLLLVAAAGTIVLMRQSLRRRRLSTGTPDDRIAGAWSEFTDALRLAGRPVPPHLAATEAAAYAQNDAGLPPLGDLVAGINTVGFAPGSADDGQAAKAGGQAVAYADALRARRSWWRRLWWTIHPGPLRWSRRS
ncbi:Transglutaminase-like superfamily protein [Paractinoplanes atraurantiacus]|uniref:Transglutaminase-like superfamily protein n=2 Tax=Paractinoplanes atraurantiacus TaxID=1036182 RepID=A0A285GRF9_9ACTN|nr:Transglutaminase-like superfamily protein [Actinoplanes atraurantiacus]